MTLIVKPHGDFEPNTTAESAKVNDQINALYVDHNGNITDANVNALANIAQSKIANLTTNLATVTDRKSWEQISTQAASNTGLLDFTTGLTAVYDEYMVTLTNIVPTVDNSNLVVRVSVAGVFQEGASDYSWIRFGGDLTTVTSPEYIAVSTDTGLVLAGGAGNAAGETLCGDIRFWAPSGTTLVKLFRWDIVYINSAGLLAVIQGVGHLRNGAAIDGIRFLFPATTIASGQFGLYGLKK